MICSSISYERFIKITFSFRLFKLSRFSKDSNYAKFFYICVFLTCLVRTILFAVASGIYGNQLDSEISTNTTTASNSTETHLNNDQKTMILLIIEPEFLLIFTYILLFWSLLSIYYESHISFFKSVF